MSSELKNFFKEYCDFEVQEHSHKYGKASALTVTLLRKEGATNAYKYLDDEQQREYHENDYHHFLTAFKVYVRGQKEARSRNSLQYHQQMQDIKLKDKSLAKGTVQCLSFSCFPHVA